MALAGFSRTLSRRRLGDGANVPTVSEAAANASALGRALGLRLVFFTVAKLLFCEVATYAKFLQGVLNVYFEN